MITLTQSLWSIIRTFVIFALLVLSFSGAAWLQTKHATLAWPAVWVAYVVDQNLGQAVAATPLNKSQPTLASTSPLGQYTDLLDAMELRLHRARAVPPSAWLGQALHMRKIYLQFVPFSGMYDHAMESQKSQFELYDAAQAERTVDRLLRPLEEGVKEQREWLNAGPPMAEIQLRLKGLRSGSNGALIKDRGGIVRVTSETLAKAVWAPMAPRILGGGLWGVLSFILIALGICWLVGRSSNVCLILLLTLLPLYLGYLTTLAQSTGTLGLRSIGIRQFQTLWGLTSPIFGLICAFCFFSILKWHFVARFFDRIVDVQRPVDSLIRGTLLAVCAIVIPFAFSQPSWQSELWLGLAIFSLGMFASQNAVTISLTNLPSAKGWPIVVCTGLAISVLAFRGGGGVRDMGTVILTLGLVGVWLMLFANRGWAISCFLVLVLFLIWWGLTHQPSLALGPSSNASAHSLTCGAGWIDKLLSRERLTSACDPVNGNLSDIARSLWFARSGIQYSGFGFGLVSLPAEGFAAVRASDRVIMQLLSDYFAAPMIATFGWLGLFAMMSFAIGLLALASLAFKSLAVIDEPNHGMALGAAIGGFGLVSSALRTVVTVAGATSSLPLTGQPAPALSFGPTASVAFAFYLGCALLSIGSNMKSRSPN